ncbi:M20/M25/M40 family metallo-hydrolase [Spirosoma taeanense]|uniref:M20/M25/M40 family metallo-hydrolase n=1 Tax=Spirosoma taeanense TaxID=2735870 RepID=A0A6M5Y3D4_9BACT|nr:M20/M25/M40 family metallo-hydrolase [Spirosoma taeanense]QJW88245.1 M20/M25/M40 family metallo-hydrolase [Spirosoma taeanense]
MQTHSVLTLFAVLTLATLSAEAQSRTAKAAPPRPMAAAAQLPEAVITRNEVESHTRFLASDELQGRRTGEPGNLTAARYIAEQFRSFGLTAPTGADSYRQSIPLRQIKPVSNATLTVGSDTLRAGKQFVVMGGGAASLTAETVFVGYGLTEADYAGKDVRGKLIVTQVGSEGATRPREFVASGAAKVKLAAEKGAVGVVELFAVPSLPWSLVASNFSRTQLAIATDEAAAQPSSIVHIWADNSKNQLIALKNGQTISIQTPGQSDQRVNAVNIAGIVEGSDPALKNEYVILSAHFDHLGTTHKQSNGATEDTIYNGARDNALGVTALLTAAKALSQQRPKRSVLILALTGEEVGLLGSRYYAEHPLVPLKQTIFDLNIDGAGYNDTTIVSVIGLERTGAKSEIEAAARVFGLGVFAEPAPEQGLFDRSDNVAFAAKGIPAPTFSPGFKTFDEAIGKYYHQTSDNPESLDFNYVKRFCQAYVHAARLIANRPTRPQWSAGDKYEAVGKALYGQ